MRAVAARIHAHATRSRRENVAQSAIDAAARTTDSSRKGFRSVVGGRVSPVVVLRGVSVTPIVVGYGSFSGVYRGC